MAYTDNCNEGDEEEGGGKANKRTDSSSQSSPDYAETSDGTDRNEKAEERKRKQRDEINQPNVQCKNRSGKEEERWCSACRLLLTGKKNLKREEASKQAMVKSVVQMKGMEKKTQKKKKKKEVVVFSEWGGYGG